MTGSRRTAGGLVGETRRRWYRGRREGAEVCRTVKLLHPQSATQPTLSCQTCCLRGKSDMQGWEEAGRWMVWSRLEPGIRQPCRRLVLICSSAHRIINFSKPSVHSLTDCAGTNKTQTLGGVMAGVKNYSVCRLLLFLMLRNERDDASQVPMEADGMVHDSVGGRCLLLLAVTCIGVGGAITKHQQTFSAQRRGCLIYAFGNDKTRRDIHAHATHRVPTHPLQCQHAL